MCWCVYLIGNTIHSDIVFGLVIQYDGELGMLMNAECGESNLGLGDLPLNIIGQAV